MTTVKARARRPIIPDSCFRRGGVVDRTTIIVVYVAFVSTATLAWQIWSAHQKKRQRNQPRRSFTNVSLSSRPPADEAQKRDDFFIDIDNLGHDDLRITEFSIGVSGGREVIRYFWRPSDQHRTLSVTAAAHGSVSVPVPASVADGAFTAPFAVIATAWVKLSTGARIYGQWMVVHPTRKSNSARGHAD